MDDLEIHSNEAPTGSSPTVKASTGKPDGVSDTDLSFRLVEPTALLVEDFNLHIDVAPSTWNAVKARFAKEKNADLRQEPQRKTILSGISAYMPSGTLTAILGASGSGKTSLRLCFRAVVSALNYFPGLSSTPSRVGPVDADSRPPEEFGITAILTYRAFGALMSRKKMFYRQR